MPKKQHDQRAYYDHAKTRHGGDHLRQVCWQHKLTDEKAIGWVAEKEAFAFATKQYISRVKVTYEVASIMRSHRFRVKQPSNEPKYGFGFNLSRHFDRQPENPSPAQL